MTSKIAMTTQTQEKAEQIRSQLGLAATPTAIRVNDMSHVFETGVMVTARVTAERFNFSMRLSELGIVPTSDKRKDKVISAIEAVLHDTQRGCLLPKDEMWYERDGQRYQIPFPNITERRVRVLFPTRYEGNVETKTGANPLFSSWHAIPLNGMTFVPFSTWEQWNEEFQKAKREHLESAQLIVENYERIRAASVRHYLHIALDVYDRLRKTAPDRLERKFWSASTGQPEERTIDPLEWARIWKRSVLAAWPTKEEIIKRYTVEERFFWAPRPSRTKVDEEMVRFIDEMDARDWTGLDDEHAEWLQRRRMLIDRLWDDVDTAQKYINSADEKVALMRIMRQVEKTELSRSHELTVAYVRSIVERSEAVFINFLGLIKNHESQISSNQINMILKVSEMIKTLSKGVDSLDAIRKQAERIEKYITESSSQLEEASKARRNKRKATGEALSDLPGIIADAMIVIRQQAESIIGHEARRTQFSDQDPALLLEGIQMGSEHASERVSRDISEIVEDQADTFALPVPESFSEDFEEDDELAVVRRVR